MYTCVWMIPGSDLENIKECFVVFHHFNIANGQVDVFVNFSMTIWMALKWIFCNSNMTKLCKTICKVHVKPTLTLNTKKKRPVQREISWNAGSRYEVFKKYWGKTGSSRIGN